MKNRPKNQEKPFTSREKLIQTENHIAHLTRAIDKNRTRIKVIRLETASLKRKMNKANAYRETLHTEL